MPLVYRYQGMVTPQIGDLLLPGSSGWGDIGAASNGEASAVFGDNIRSSTRTLATGSTRVLPVVAFTDATNAPRWDITVQPPSTAPTTITGPWSMRFYHRYSTVELETLPMVRWLDTGVTILTLSSVQGAGTHRPGFSGFAATTAITPATGLFRYEIQYDPTAASPIVMRVYTEDAVAAPLVFSSPAVGASITWDEIRIGWYTAGSALTIGTASQYGDIEIWNDIDLGGQFVGTQPGGPGTAISTTYTGAPSTNPSIETRFNFNGTADSTPQAVLTQDIGSGGDYTILAQDLPYVDEPTNIYDRTLTIYQPTGTPPAGGWPVAVWAHSGFGTEGDKNDLPSNWRDDLLNNGIAVATVQYVRSSYVSAGYGLNGGGLDSATQGAIPRGGRFPSHIVDFKRAAAFIRDNAGGPGAPDLNGNKMIACGFSFGGYVALGAALTANLAYDSGGVPGGRALSLAQCALDSDAWGDGYGGTDPEFIGVFTYVAPTDFYVAAQYDPTYSTSGSIINQIAGRAFYNLSTVSGTTPDNPYHSLADLVATADASGVTFPPIVYVRGTADYLVHWEHEPLLSAALTAAVQPVDYTLVEDPCIHPYANRIYDRTAMLSAMDSFINPAAPGGGGGKFPSIPTLPTLPSLPRVG